MSANTFTVPVQDTVMTDRHNITSDASASVDAALEFGAGALKMVPFTKQTFNHIVVLFKKRFELRNKLTKLPQVKYFDLTFLPSADFISPEDKLALSQSLCDDIIARKKVFLNTKIDELSTTIRSIVENFSSSLTTKYNEASTQAVLSSSSTQIKTLLEDQVKVFNFKVERLDAALAVTDAPKAVSNLLKEFTFWFNKIFIKSFLEKTQGCSSSTNSTSAQKEQQGKRKGKTIQSQSRSPQTSIASQASTRPTTKKVFVNNISSTDIPTWVVNFLSLGANFNLTSSLTFDDTQKDWLETKEQVLVALQKQKRIPKSQEILKKTESLLDRQTEYLYGNFVSSLKNINRRYIKFHNKSKAVFNFIVNNNLIVTPADKNLGLTIANADHYKSVMIDFIQKSGDFDLYTHHPREIPYQYNIYIDRVVSRWRAMLLGLRYDGSDFSKLFDPDNVPATDIPRIYGLWKLHKIPLKIRPIVPNFAWLTTKASKYLADKWQPFVNAIPWILPNSLALVNKLDSPFVFWLDELYIASFDVNAMYPSINYQTDTFWKLLRKSLKFACQRLNMAFAKPYFLNDFALLQWVLTSSFVQFQDQVYTQTSGLSMGTPVAPVVANLFMAGAEIIARNQTSFESAFKNSYFIYYRYLDDIFVANQNFHQVDTFLKMISDFCLPTDITFTDTNPDDRSKTVYLDLNVFVYRKGRNSHFIGFSPYDKPLNKHIYTNPKTFFPFKYIYNWIEGESIRLIRNSTYDLDYELALSSFKSNLLNRGYNEKHVDYFLNKRSYEDRVSLLRTSFKPDNDEKSVRLFIKNNATRPIIAKLLSRFVLDFNSEFEPDTPLTLTPVIYKGRTILSTMNRARHQVLEDSNPVASSSHLG